MNTIVLTIDGIEVKTTKGKRILEAALDSDIYVPNLCALQDIRLPFGACRLCQVQIKGRRGTITACSEPAADGMVVFNNVPEVNNVRRKVLEIMLARHPHSCLTCHRLERCKPFDICLRNVAVSERCVTCPKNRRCELQKATDFIGLDDMPFTYVSKGLQTERENPFIVRNNNICILCGRCVRVCQEILGIEAISFNRRGMQTFIGGAFGKPLIESGCTFCGSCVEVCPTGALMDRNDEWDRWIDRKAASIRCQYSCPAGVDVPQFIRFIRESKYAEATRTIQEKVPFAKVCSLICAHPCEKACRRGDLDQPVAIKALERFAVEHMADYGLKESTETTDSGKKVAIVGSGPAGLTAAYYLAKKWGHSVTVFESSAQPGGMMRALIPDYKLPRNILDAEIKALGKLGIEMKTKSPVESAANLLAQGYNAVLLATGASKGIKLGITGEEQPGVMDGLWFLGNVTSGHRIALGERTAVIGNGEMAIEVARVALRSGAKLAMIVTSVTKTEFSAPDDEVLEAIAEGVEIKEQVRPVKITGTDGKLRIDCIPAIKEGQGKNGSAYSISVDNLIIAVGGIPDLIDKSGLTVSDGNFLKVGMDNMTSNEGVFACGGVSGGGVSFIDAVASGRKAAISIDRYLGRSGDINDVLTPASEEIPKIGKMDNFASRKRQVMPSLSPAQRVRSFDQTELGFTDEIGAEEARRCMGCDLRFKVGRMAENPEMIYSQGNSASQVTDSL